LRNLENSLRGTSKKILYIHHYLTNREGHHSSQQQHPGQQPISRGYDSVKMSEENNNNGNQQPIKDNDRNKEELGEPLLPQDGTDEPAVLVQPSPAALT
jgi:hypothetical protein